MQSFTKVKKLNRLPFYLLSAALAWLWLPACGKVTRGDDLELVLSIPEKEDPELFWYGVSSRRLRVSPDGEQPTEYPWNPEQRVEVPLRKGDQVEFIGSDASARALVSGSVKLDGEKKHVLRLRRVL